MESKVLITDILIEYDTVHHLVLAIDELRVKYLCLLIHDEPFTFLLVEISDSELKELLSGRNTLDVRSVYTNKDVEKYSLASHNDDGTLYIYNDITFDMVYEHWLPEEGCFLPEIDID